MLARYRIPVVAFVMLSAGAFTGIPAADANAVPCEGFTHVPGQGPSCPLGNGMWEIVYPDGSRAQTHGPDPLHLADDEGLMPLFVPQDPICVTNPAEYAMVVIYARPFDKPDNFPTKQTQLRDLVRQATGKLMEEAGEFAHSARYRVRCAGGLIDVKNEVLPTSSGSDTFASITNDLKAKGYNSILSKHWVYYDDTIPCGCAGQGHLYGDDRLILDNFNNGAPGTVPMFAVSYNTLSLRVWMHENGHNLGAVQNSAPDSSAAGHCLDGWDVMCYADGGNCCYNPNVCVDREHFDCDHDTYFHPNPAPGSYLATKWNLASTLNRFMTVGPLNLPPVAAYSYSCSNLSCSFNAASSTDPDGTVVAYSWNWGDGSPIGSGVAPPKTFAAPGSYTVSLTVTDNGGATDTTSKVVTVFNDLTPPVTTHALAGTTGSAPWYRSDVTVTLSATDSGGSGLELTEYKVDGAPSWTTYSAPFKVTTNGAHSVQYRSKDNAGNVEATKTVSFSIDKFPPDVTLGFSTPTSNGFISYTASDAESGLTGVLTVYAYMVQHQTSVQTSPVKTVVCQVPVSGATQTGSCFHSGLAGRYCYNANIGDAAGNIKNTAATCTIKV